MSYSSGISSGGSNLQDVLRAQRALAALQTDISKGGASAWPGAGAGGKTSSASTNSATAGASATGAAAAQAGPAASLTSQMSSLLMQFQQVLSQFGQGAGTPPAGPGANPQPSGSTASTATTASSTTTTSTTTTATTSDPSQAVQSGSQRRHRHHHHQDSQSDSSSGQSSTATEDPLAQLLGLTASTSGGKVSQSSFETALSNRVGKSDADSIFSVLDQNGDGSINQSEAQNALKQFQQSRNATGTQSPSAPQTGGQGGSPQPSLLSGSSLLLSAQQMGQAS